MAKNRNVMKKSSAILVCCLALASLPAAGVEAHYATNGIRLVTSADLALKDYVFTRTCKYVRFEGVATARSSPKGTA